MSFGIVCLIIILVSAAACSIGYKKYVWFFSVGYGFAITAICICLMAIYPNQLVSIPKLLACLLFIIYGLRLGLFLLIREMKKNSTYTKKMKTELDKKISFFVKTAIWLTCTALYFTMTSPVIFRFANNIESDLVFVIGILVAAFGIIFEIIADKQKSAIKKVDPNSFCNTGLYKLVRCPNYLGELIIWTGVFISGFTALVTPIQWISAIIGYIGIIFVMFSGAKRIEIRQDKTYGDNPEYIKYSKTTPIIIPFVPLYSVKKHKWLVA